MAEPLKPRGLPYGENAPAADRMREAGLSTSGPTSAPGPNVAPAAPAEPARVPADRPGAPVSDDPLMVLQPSTPLTAPLGPREQLRAIAERSQNPLMRLIAERLAEDT